LPEIKLEEFHSLTLCSLKQFTLRAVREVTTQIVAMFGISLMEESLNLSALNHFRVLELTAVTYLP
jgi:hypothetical protein